MCIWLLGGGFKYFLFPPLFGEASHFDYYFSDGLKPPTRLYHHKYGSISAECFFQLGIGFLPSRHVPPFRRQHQTWSTSGSTSCLSSLRWPLRCCENMTWTVWCDWHTHTHKPNDDDPKVTLVQSNYFPKRLEDFFSEICELGTVWMSYYLGAGEPELWAFVPWDGSTFRSCNQNSTGSGLGWERWRSSFKMEL